ncbi:hypothetical protein [Hymenobacter mucosus]|jgi:hypothetical protein|uniref:Uncharacterized protein n=1 Tax=Hymenobacter mucosus TaxID=1411120 RepID=A0A238ZWJ5_9BACT|nr:hypothetical protein [Hymenobacter mucosus]SNR87502.1 hypothetical protein SAMN06269173_11023 [Hymenobacter mucosus]
MTATLAASINATASPWTLVSAFLEHKGPYVSPFQVNALKQAGLLDIVTGLQGSAPERRAQAYVRLQQKGLVYGEEQIDYIAHVQTQIRAVQQELQDLDPGELAQLDILAKKMQQLVASAQEYFRK